MVLSNPVPESALSSIIISEILPLSLNGLMTPLVTLENLSHGILALKVNLLTTFATFFSCS